MTLDMIAENETAQIGHNSGDVNVSVEVRLFNSLHRYSRVGLKHETLNFPAGSTVGDIVKEFQIPLKDIYLVLRNGSDITPGCLGVVINKHAVLNDGDVIALSGPVPFSWGYGAPVV